MQSGSRHTRGNDVENAFAELALERGFRPALSRAALHDFEHVSGGTIVAFKPAALGARDLRAHMFQLALALREHPSVERAVLVTRLRNVRLDRLEQEWRRLGDVLQPDLARRLFVVAVDDTRSIVLPHTDPELETLRRMAHELLVGLVQSKSPSAPWTAKTFGIWLLLLDAWLRGEDPMPIGELGRRARCSQPTIASTLDRLTAYGEARRTSSRGVAFTALPRTSLNEILVLADTLRPALRYVDASGRPADPERLLRRLAKVAPTRVALGGVVSARHHVRTFDLNGTPRIDLAVHGSGALGWLERVDPALRLAEPGDGAPVLVIHTIQTTEPRFDEAGGHGLPIAGPAETLLDLYDLRLVAQAEDFVRTLRGRNG